MTTKIYGYFVEQGATGGPAFACTADGTVIAQHFCSSEGFAKSDLGMGGQDWSHKHERYDAAFPDGWETEFVYGGFAAYLQVVGRG